MPNGEGQCLNGGDADWVVASRRTEVIRPFLKAGWLPSRQADYIAVSLTIGPIVRRIGAEQVKDRFCQLSGLLGSILGLQSCQRFTGLAPGSLRPPSSMKACVRPRAAYARFNNS